MDGSNAAWRRHWLPALGVLLVLLYGTAVLNNQTTWDEGRLLTWLHDDMMISMRYGRHLAAGLGPVWNPGAAPVEGYSNFGWLLLMALVHLLQIPIELTSLVVLLVNILLAGIVLALAARLMRHLYPRPGLALPAMLVALLVSYDLLRWTTTGLETTAQTALFLYLLLRLLGETANGRPRATTWLLAGGLGLIRADGTLLIALLMLAALLLGQNPRRLARFWLLALFLPALHLLWRYSIYGSWLPNTYLLKVDEVSGRLAAGLRYPLRLARFYAPATVVAVTGLALSANRRRRVVAGLGIPLLLYGVYAGGDDFAGLRFMAPWLPLLLVLAFGSLSEFLGPGRRRDGALLALLVSSITIAFYNPLSGPGFESRLARAGRYLAATTAPDTTVAHFWAGTAAYFSERPAVDMLGKNDAVIAALSARPGSDKPGHNKFDYDYSLGVLRPDLVIAPVHPNEVATAATLSALSRGPDAYAGLFYQHPQFKQHYAANLLLVGDIAIFVRQDWPGREALMSGECLAVEREGLVALGLQRVCLATNNEQGTGNDQRNRPAVRFR